MKPIISGSGTGKNTYTTKFFLNNVYDKIVSCAYYGTNYDYENMKYMLYASNNPILFCDKLKDITLSLNEHVVGSLEFKNTLSRADAVSLITTSGNNFFSIEEAALTSAALSSYQFAIDDGSQFVLIESKNKQPIVFGIKTINIEDIGEATVVSTPIWSTPEFFCDKFTSELPCCVYFEGVCQICNRIITRKIIERSRFTLTSEENELLDHFCSAMGVERNLASDKATKIPIVSKANWDNVKSPSKISYEAYLRGARLYNKALRSIGGEAFEYDPTRVNVDYSTLVYFDKAGSHRLNFNPYKRVLDSNSLVFIDSLTCLLWTDSGNQARSKGGVPTDLLTTIQTTTFSNVRPLYVPNPSFDPFGGTSFNEMIGGSFVSDFDPNGYIGGKTQIGDRRDGRRCLHIDTWLVGNPYEHNANLTIAVDNENKVIIMKLYEGSFVENKVVDIFVSTNDALFSIFKNSVIYRDDFDVSFHQTYDPDAFPKSYKEIEKVRQAKLFTFIQANADHDSEIFKYAQYMEETIYD